MKIIYSFILLLLFQISYAQTEADFCVISPNTLPGTTGFGGTGGGGYAMTSPINAYDADTSTFGYIHIAPTPPFFPPKPAYSISMGVIFGSTLPAGSFIRFRVGTSDLSPTFTYSITTDAETIIPTQPVSNLPGVAPAYIGDASPSDPLGFQLTQAATRVTFTLNVPANYFYNGSRMLRVYSIEATGICSPPLPVSLTGFQAVKRGSSAELAWATASEKNNLGFEILKSRDLASWEKIGYVSSSVTNSNSRQEYGFTDAALAAGTTYYRLKQVDVDGKYTLSPIRSLDTEGDLSALLRFTNPVGNSIAFESEPAGVADLAIVQTDGRVVIAGIPALKSIPVSQLGRGVYILRVRMQNGAVVARRFVKE
ncbi:T9SS type A sorting domain-containing protein [Siphonobacter aquaeclarae]|uniref:Por secretion system C-terminal sorting domain-containing protein n=1 Tax=Siphonobacter aquaeclarae TaxID=563176 RepID=A0A1G9R0D1_9BACT|nr:T9SS type A sorting domain-containing protein [Siphonobacter aquaeclarae]SDM16601.1 Por secretion system C-terminal sorting domain-containing protein [Siphonobacter aquaeclarae]